MRRVAHEALCATVVVEAVLMSQAFLCVRGVSDNLRTVL